MDVWEEGDVGCFGDEIDFVVDSVMTKETPFEVSNLEAGEDGHDVPGSTLHVVAEMEKNWICLLNPHCQ